MGFYHKLEGPKLVYADIARTYKFAYDTDGHYLGNTFYFIPTDNSFILVVLCSKVTEMFCHQITATEPGDFVRLHTTSVSKFPISSSTPQDNAIIREIAGKLIEPCENQENAAALEQELNEHIYRLFDLTPEEKVGSTQ